MPSAAETRHVVVLARAPSAAGKTRLTARFSERRACTLREALLLDTVDAVRAARLPLIVSFTPDTALDEMSRLVPDARLRPQRGDDIGQRMRHAINDSLEQGADSVVLIGSDLPTLPASHLLDAFAMLDDADLVLGRSDDGGFYLVGARGAMPDVFRGVQWDGPDVASSVAGAALKHDLTVAFARDWWDVDRPEDLQRLVRESAASAPGASCDPAIARRVREFLERGN